MSSCPSCHGQILIAEANFGTLLACPLCSSIFFVGWDGQPELSANPVVEEPSTEADLPEPEPFQAEENLPAFTPIESSGIDAFSTGQEYFSNDIAPQPTQDLAGAFESVEKYSNQTQETLPLSYNIFIRGLDLPKQVQELRDAIEDARFGWEAEKIISQINNGELVIEKLSPVKASILIQRVKYADIQIEWEQNVLI